MRYLPLFLILVLAFILRSYGLNWDQEFHLHPDERFLTMVGNTMKIPENIFLYLDPHASLMNPTNIGYSFFVYGIFPLTLNKLIAVGFGHDNYNDFTIQGRFLSGLLDLLVIFFIYKTVELFEKHFNLKTSIKYMASFLYAIAVLPIQLSHFFAVDTFLNFFVFTSFYFALRFYFTQKTVFILISVTLLSLAISSKISGFSVLPLNLFLIMLPYAKKLFTKKLQIITILLLYFIVLYLGIRIFDPYLFKDNNILDISINPVFLENVKTLKSLSSKDAWFPPSTQWINKPAVWFSLYNICLFGVGLPSFIMLLIGIYETVKKRRIILISILTWMLIFFFYQSVQFTKTMRYLIILYPFMAIFAGFGFVYLTKNLRVYLKILIIILLLIWPLAFFSIYTKDHSRIEASKWIYENIENNSIILGEHWDDALPLPLTKNYGKNFTIIQLPVFGEDNAQKWKEMNSLLQNANYLTFSSNRGWGSITTISKRYPIMSKFYNDLFAGKLEYKKIKEFSSYPSLKYLGITFTIPDDSAEEAFTVYDHPRVIIFKKN